MQNEKLPKLREGRVHGTKDFPCAIYWTGSRKKGIMVQHHWHEEIEIIYFSGGEFCVEINMEKYRIGGECIFFINPGELHSISVEKDGECMEDAVVFHMDILNFASSMDQVQTRLLQPIQNGRLLFPRCIEAESPAFKTVRDAFLNIQNAFGRSGTGEGICDGQAVTEDITCQLAVKASLLRILTVLSANRMFTETSRNNDRRIETIKKAIGYIQDNYKEKIYIRDLADLIGMNEQYFCRFFKKAIGRSPIEYVNEYRIKKARHYLEETDLTVMEICLECGYNNLGNFLREFRRYTDTTPLQYRKRS